MKCKRRGYKDRTEPKNYKSISREHLIQVISFENQFTKSDTRKKHDISLELILRPIHKNVPGTHDLTGKFTNSYHVQTVPETVSEN